MSEKFFDVYIDFGSSKIIATAFNKKNKKSFSVSSKCFSSFKSTQLNFKDSKIVLEKLILEIEKKTGEYLNSINLMIDSPEVLSIGVSLSKKNDGKKIRKSDIQYLIQDAKQQVIKFHPNKNIIHIIASNYKVDNNNFDYPPIDVECNFFVIDIIFICYPKELIKNLESLFYENQININQVLSSSYAKSLNCKEQYINFFDKIVFLDVGYEKTSIIVFNKNKLKSFNTLPIGGNHITKDISKILNYSIEESEDIKINLNIDILFSDDEKDFSILTRDFLKKYNREEKSLKLIKKIILARIDEILNLCLETIRSNENHDKIDKFKIVLMGQGSKILNNDSIPIKEIIPIFDEIDFFSETITTICESGLKLNQGLNQHEVVTIPKKNKSTGFFAKLFHFFE